MLAKRIITCLDVKDEKVVKGIRFKRHRIVGDILELATRYSEQGADELVFYDITASPEKRQVDYKWVQQIAEHIDIPFCVAGGIKTLKQAEKILYAGADKISINSPAIANPNLITLLANEFGSQCIVVGVDSKQVNGKYWVYQLTGNVTSSAKANWLTENWLREIESLGGGEIVLNCMNTDGTKQGYDLAQIKSLQTITRLPLIASGGAGSMQDFANLFLTTSVSGALAASVFHENTIAIPALKKFLSQRLIEVRNDF